MTRIRSYFIALHEVGHVVLEARPDDPVLPREESAWRWAPEEAVEPPSEGVRRHIFRVLTHYAIVEGRRQVREADESRKMIPGPDDPLWELLAEMIPGPDRSVYEAVKIAAATSD